MQFGIFPRSFPYSHSSHISTHLQGQLCLSFYLDPFHSLSHDQGYMPSIVMVHAGLTSLITISCLLLLYPFMHHTSQIVCIYISSLEQYLKVTRTTKELIQVLLFIPLEKSDKQDRIDSTFIIPTSLFCYGLAFSLGGCTSQVVCWVVTKYRILQQVQWLKKVSQYCVILKRLENCGISKRNQARCLQDG